MIDLGDTCSTDWGEDSACPAHCHSIILLFRIAHRSLRSLHQPTSCSNALHVPFSLQCTYYFRG